MGIVLAAAITLIVGYWIFHLFVRRLQPTKTALLVCLLASLPMSPAANLILKRPIFAWLERTLVVPHNTAEWPLWFGLLGLLVVGITEEAIKLLPLLVPRLRQLLRTRRGVAIVCLSLGFGFGFGEVLFLALQIYLYKPEVAALPFYKLSGFIGERVAVMLLHSAFLVFPLSQLSAGRRRFVLGILTAMLMHAVVDLPAALYQMKAIAMHTAGICLFISFIALSWLLLRYIDRARPMIPVTEVEGSRVLYRRQP